jgi:hypothetical protein
MAEKSVENKKTTEILDQLAKLTEDDWKSGGKYEVLIGELRNREPFLEILDEDWDTGLPKVWEAIEELREEIKLLKRHSHNEKNGDVLVRI